MRITQVGNIKDHVAINVKNGEASATIPRGTPVVLAINGTDDGLGVVLPATAGAQKSGTLQMGVVLGSLAQGQLGESMVYGVVPYAIITRATRAASSDSWSASASHSNYWVLAIDTLNNAFLPQASSLLTNTFAPQAALLDSMAAIAASATATSDTRTAITTSARVFVRMM